MTRPDTTIFGPLRKFAGTIVMLMGKGNLSITTKDVDGWERHDSYHHAPTTHFIWFDGAVQLWEIDADEPEPIVFRPRLWQADAFSDRIRYHQDVPTLTICAATIYDGRVEEMTLKRAYGKLMHEGCWT